MLLASLPLDIFFLIAGYVDARTFLRLCSTCKGLNEPRIRLQADFWRPITQNAFRLPDQGLLQHDGPRWQKLFRRFCTKTRVYSWGYFPYGWICLQHARKWASENEDILVARNFVHWPVEVKCSNIGTVVDMQCSGDTTQILTSKGTLYTTAHFGYEYRNGECEPLARFTRLHFPDVPNDTDYPSPAVAIRQFSSGRKHILGLSDQGIIWLWSTERQMAVQITLNPPIRKHESHLESEISTSELPLVFESVHTGSDQSAAYITGHGIIIWGNMKVPTARAIEMDNCDFIPLADLDSWPHSDINSPYHGTTVIVSYIIVGYFTLLTTSDDKLFAYKIWDPEDSLHVGEAFELTGIIRDHKGRGKLGPVIVEGAFHSFAVLTGDGQVVIADVEYLEARWAEHIKSNDCIYQDTHVHRIPMLQQRGVISIAFGQSHYLALFRNGSISSFGREEEGCGALGIGGHRDIKRLRGYECESICQSAFPLEDSHFSGCQVWFEKEKLQWLKHLSSGGCDPKEAEERFQLYQQDTSVQADVSDWVEYLGINWAARVGAQVTDEFGLSSYFGFRISAGSRHSAALIIVNENLASHIRDAYLVKREPQQGPQQVQQISPRTSHSPFSLKQSASRLFDALTRPSRSMSFSRLLNTPTSKLEIKCTSSSTQAVVPSRGVRRPPERSELENSSETQDKKYQWMYEEFPRLRLDDGREMPGDIPFHNQA